jgi:hypothetical protein
MLNAPPYEIRRSPETQSQMSFYLRVKNLGLFDLRLTLGRPVEILD